MGNQYIFFGTGADFTISVIENLKKLDCLPGRIVIPEYPPYRVELEGSLKLDRLTTRNRLINIAESLEIPVSYAPENRSDELLECLIRDAFDFILIACWPYKISSQIYKTASKAAMNLHPSLLPAYRGRDPVKAQIENREKSLGVSLHLLNDDFDCGELVESRGFAQPPNLNRSLIEKQAAILGAKMFLDACKNFGGPEWHPRPQNISRTSVVS